LAVFGSNTISTTGSITSGNVLTGGLISATGTITGSSHLGSVVSVTGNVTSGNVLTGGLISATGNVTGQYINGNGYFLTGVITSVANINLGNSNVTVTAANANVTVGVGGTANVAVFATTGEYVTGVLSVSGNVTGGNVLTGGLVSVTGNVTAGNLSVSTGTVTVGNIVNGGTSAVGNIGSTTVPFNTIFAKATSAQYADLAENYLADAAYAAGTVVSFGGDLEITASTADGDTRVAGVVSTNPSYLMNGGLVGDNVVAVALTGRVPCRVTGNVRKGDLMVSNGDGTARAEANPAVGTVIGKALADFDGVTGVIEVVVGRV
jgi:hypothetical protein